MTLSITDPKLIARARSLAKAAGRYDWRKMMAEDAERAVRGLYGLDADVSLGEAAMMLSVHKNTIGNFRKRGLLPGAYYMSRTNLRIPLKEVLAIKERTVGVAA